MVIVTLIKDGDDLILPLNDELLSQLDLKVGDTVVWKDNGDGSFSFSKKQQQEETELVLVETISTFRHRYVVEVPKGKKEWALDTVTCEEVNEFSQEHIGESIVSHRVISTDEYHVLFDEDNEYLKSWDKDLKESFIHPWEKQNENKNNL